MAGESDFQWQDEYSVGIFEIDRQHQEIIKLINDLSLLCAVDNSKSYDTFKIMLFSAAEYLQNHFWSEEVRMKSSDYPEFLEHKKRHVEMAHKINEMANNIGKDDSLTIKSVTEYFREWYREHLLSWDKEMGEYFIKN